MRFSKFFYTMSKAERVAMGAYWTKTIEKEAALRSLWFRKNEARLNEIANKIPSKIVNEDVKEKIKQERLAAFQNSKKNIRIKREPLTLDFNGNIQDIMKPVNPAIKKLIYTGANRDGRINYLNERVKLLPKDRYYFRECTSWDYGWNILDKSKIVQAREFGRKQIIKETFYRRRGIERDPDWYREPAINLTFCTSCKL
ncbi:hypothetical protein ABEB36_015582 [Hypothenemus hampei]|uniref:Sperm microtubule inner protein 1 C-terminal domain-containing protein n=1 Tax=Hypothenemus hampei TaxID=57062 RepID=A0ABD1DZC2_HYPHA